MAKANIPVEFSPIDVRKVEAAIARIQSQAKGVNFGKGAESINKLSRPLGRITGQASEFQKSLEASNARVLAFGASVAVINKLSQAFGALVNNTVKVESSFAKINTILGGTQKQLEEFGNGIFKVAQRTATSFDQVAEGALELARQGLTVAESLSRVETALKLVRVAGIDSQQAVAGLTAAIKGFEGAGLTVAAIGDKLAEVDTKFAVSTEDLINGLERASASARVAGVSFDELLAAVTTVQERTQRGGAVIGNAFKTIFARLGRTDTLKTLQDLGISVLDTEGNVRSAIPLFQELAGELNKLGLKSVEAGEVIQKVAGVRQRDILISLVEDLNSGQSQFAKALDISASAAGSLDSKNAKLNDTLEALINNLTVGGEKLASVLGNIGFTDQAKDLLKLFGDIVNSITDVLQGDTIGSKFAKGLIKGIGATLTPGIALVGAIFIKLFVDLAKFGASSLKQILGINKAAQLQNSLQQSVLQTLLQNESIQREILALEGNKVAQEQLLLKIYTQQAAALARVQKAAAVVSPGLFKGGMRGGEGGVTKRGAGGYVSAESRDVSNGVGGAPASSKVVSIPNFAFGGGQQGTMVANTSEYYVPNYKGGGDAIFNKDMVRSMGLPGGAKKLNAAGGFIPNFATKASKGKKFGLDERFAMVVPSRRGRTTGNGISKTGNSYTFPVVGYDESNLKAKNDTQLKNIVANSALKMASKESLSLTGKNPLPAKVDKNNFNPGAIGGLAGTIFEAAISSLLKGPEFDLLSNSTFDFMGSKARGDLSKLFPALPERSTFIEAKIAASTPLMNSMADKMEKFRGGEKSITPYASGVIKSSKLRAGGKFSAAASRAEFGPTSRSSKGYIPNFFGGALEEAIDRESQAGVPLNQIRVNQSGKLRNAQNPKGLAVTNTKDEPTGAIPNFNKGGMGDGMGGGLMGIFVVQAISGMTSSFVDAESALGKLIGVITTAATALMSFSLITPAITKASAAMMAFSKVKTISAVGKYGGRRDFDAPMSRGRAAAGKAAGFGGKALGALGPIGMVATIAVPLVMALTKTKDQFQELNRELSNIDLSKLSEGGAEQVGTLVARLETELARRNKLGKDKEKLGGGKGDTTEEVLQNAVKGLDNIPKSFFKREVKDQETFVSALAAFGGGEKGLAAVQEIINKSQDEEVTYVTNSGGSTGNAQAGLGASRQITSTLNAEKFLINLIAGMKNLPEFQESKEGKKQTQEERVANSNGVLSILDVKNIKSAQRAGLASRRKGESGDQIDKSQEMALKLAGNLGRLERERLVANKAITDARIEQTEASRKLGSEMAKAALAATDGVVGNTAMAEAIKTAVEEGKSFEEILQRVNKLKGEGSIEDGKSEAALQEAIESYRAQNEEIKEGNSDLDERLKKQQRMADMSSLDRANEERRNDLKELSEDVPKRLADNLESSIGSAMDNLASGTYDSLGDVFLNIALDFGKALQQEISSAVAKNLVQSFTGSGAGKGLMDGIGKMFGFNSGGIVTGGGGVKDDVPAKLTSGEYVIKKSSVQKYGVDFLDKLNSGGIQGLQNGGSLMTQGADNTRTDKFWSDKRGYSEGGARSRAYLEEAKKRDFFVPGQRGFGSIVGKENLLAFSQQGVTRGATDVISSSAGGASINLEDQSARLTAFGRRRDSPAKRALQEAQGQAFDLYQQSAAEEQRVIQENKDAKKARSKAFKQAVVGAFVNATMAGVSAGLNNMGGASASPLDAAGNATVTPSSAMSSPTMYNSVGQIVPNTNIGTAAAGSTGGFSQYYSNASPTFGGMRASGPMQMSYGDYMYGSGGGMNNSIFNRANGGLMSGGGSNSANALLMDGEYVMGSEASSSLGKGTLDSINAMNYANGGSVGGSTAGGGSGENADVGTLNIEINIEKDGNASSSASGSGEEDPEKAKEFSKKVKDVVLNVINEEKRVSGSLFTRNK